MNKVLKRAANLVSNNFHLMLLIDEAVSRTKQNLEAGNIVESEAVAFFDRQLFNLQYFGK